MSSQKYPLHLVWALRYTIFIVAYKLLISIYGNYISGVISKVPFVIRLKISYTYTDRRVLYSAVN